jgi:hypothetical protein
MTQTLILQYWGGNVSELALCTRLPDASTSYRDMSKYLEDSKWVPNNFH